MVLSTIRRIFVIRKIHSSLYNMKTEKQQRIAAAAFAKRWEGRGYEKGESQTFWIELLTEIFGVESPSVFITFEQQAQLDHTSFIDGMIPSTHVMIEQKSLGKDLRQAIRQSDGSLLTPFQQAQRYSAALPYSQRPRWIVTCNFAEFDVYDMENPKGEPSRILLKDLEKEYYRLQFLVEQQGIHLQREMEVSMKAGEIVGKLYDAFVVQYDADDPQSLRYLNILCVRLVFCLYAEDAGIFGRRDMFHDYLAQFDAGFMRMGLVQLFEVLNTPADKRSKYLNATLAAFPYTNGGLFAEDIDIPQFTDELRETLLQHASLDFDWSEISPTIFGGVFESTLNPETRRSGGMHYTSIENIHKVIDPLFYNGLLTAFESCKEETNIKKRLLRLHELQDQMAQLRFFDPACGSGNFLTETYLSLRRLENEIIKQIYSVEQLNAFENPIKVNIHQFYGIEINDFAVTVATTALWISEAQMMAETEKIIHHDIDFLPLKSYANITEGNSLRIAWEEVCPKEELDYIIGNPPFVGSSLQSKEQKEDMFNTFVDKKGKTYKMAGRIDYVGGWYYKAAKLMQGSNIRAALVSTNSITQGEQVAAIWKPLKELFGIHIDFAYRTFRWDSEASLKAHVHCVIIGFSTEIREGKSDYTGNIAKNCNSSVKLLFDNGQTKECNNINAYLMDAPDIFIESRSKPICNVPPITKGCQPTDGGNLIIEAKDYDEFIKKEPDAKRFVKKLIGAQEFINRKDRYCLWLVGATPAELKRMPLVMRRIEGCREMRLKSSDAATRRLADTPTLFRETYNPPTTIIVPSVSSERRKYVPMGFIDDKTIATNLVLIIPNATLYHFGILESNVHMAWMRAVCGRLKSDYRYSKDVVYNNFPWPTPTAEQKAKIEQSAQAILDARALYPDSSLADLYDPTLMPKELLQAHRQNDRAVMAAYGFSTKMTESECVAELFKRYAEMVE